MAPVPMPTYEYACDACGLAFEKEQRITEAPIRKCPKCGKQKARRMINGGGFILKGGGWESDLYSGPSNRGSSSSSESSSSESSSSSGDSKTEKSPAKKSKKKETKAD
ncbi:MAG: zinc ribbon domain-containing protein [Polyangiales bacterium]